MRVILVSADYAPARVAKFLDASVAEGWPAKGGVKCFEPLEVPDAPDTPLQPGAVRLIMSRYIGGNGAFEGVRLVKDLAVILNKEPATLVLDSTTGSTRYSDLDRHGIRASEIPALIAKTLYWMAHPPVVVHFIPATLKPYFVREWGQLVEYAPVETVFIGGQDVAAVRINPIWQRALAKRTIYTPKERLKRFLRRAVVSRIAKLIPRFSFFR